MQNVKRTRREISRLVLTLTMACMMAALLASCETTTPAPEIIQQIDNRITNVDNRIEETNAQLAQLNADDVDALNYVVAYKFGKGSFSPVSAENRAAVDEQLAREAFFGALRTWIGNAQDKGFRVELDELESGERPVESYFPSATLTNAQAISEWVELTADDPGTNKLAKGIARQKAGDAQAAPGVLRTTHQIQMEAVIKALAERAGDPALAIPVRADKEFGPLPVQMVTVRHSATSGVGASECKQAITITTGVIVLPEADYDVYVEGHTSELSKDEKGRLQIRLTQSSCEASIRTFSAYLMVVLKNPVVVAQYRVLTIEKGRIGDDRQLPVPLTEGAPACPPPQQNLPGEEYKAFPRRAADQFKQYLVKHGVTCV
jgi:hypothetical protein